MTTDKGIQVLVVDDEPQIRKLLRVALTAHGYKISEASDGQEGIHQAALTNPEMVIVDLGLPDMDGKEVVRRIREWSSVPILILSARDQEEEKIAALDLGADDYVTKPFSIGELMARMRVAQRRLAVNEDGEAVVTCGELVIDLALRKVTVSGQEVHLTPTEYDIMKVLAQHAGRVLTHKQLLKAVWGTAYNEDTHYIRVYIGQLRRKLEENPARPRYIVTESGIGYRLLGR